MAILGCGDAHQPASTLPEHGAGSSGRTQPAEPARPWTKPPGAWSVEPLGDRYTLAGRLVVFDDELVVLLGTHGFGVRLLERRAGAWRTHDLAPGLSSRTASAAEGIVAESGHVVALTWELGDDGTRFVRHDLARGAKTPRATDLGDPCPSKVPTSRLVAARADQTRLILGCPRPTLLDFHSSTISRRVELATSEYPLAVVDGSDRVHVFRTAAIPDAVPYLVVDGSRAIEQRPSWIGANTTVEDAGACNGKVYVVVRDDQVLRLARIDGEQQDVVSLPEGLKADYGVKLALGPSCEPFVATSSWIAFRDPSNAWQTIAAVPDRPFVYGLAVTSRALFASYETSAIDGAPLSWLATAPR